MDDLTPVLRRLNQEQQEAVLHDGNTVVLAGPGSGKTATLVAKIWHLLETEHLGPRGIATITYNNDCVRELRNRLRDLGIIQRRALFLGTVHSFCLNAILRPYAGLTLEHFESGVEVAAPRLADEILDQTLAQIRPDQDIRWYGPILTRYRRRQACHEDVSGFDDDDPTIYQEYINRLTNAGLVDFELMVSLALKIIEDHAWVRELITARYPWLLVDEYQDLGGPLDRIVTTLAAHTDIKIFAVGDPDQTIYDFTGADPIYLTRLSARADFKTIRLRFNYRSGRRLMGAAEAALAPDEPRPYEPDPERDDLGEVYFQEAGGSLERHAEVCVQEIIPKLRAEGVPLQEIAILYRQRGPLPLFSSLVSRLARDDIPFLAERDGTYPNSPLIRWLQECAAWSVSPAETKAIPFNSLVFPFHELLMDAGMAAHGAPSLETRSKLFHALTSECEAEMPLGNWVRKFENATDLLPVLRKATGAVDDLEAIEQLMEDVAPGNRLAGHRLADFANYGRVEGKVVLTSLHSSKGREFDAVILPGLVEGLLPRRPWDRSTRRYEEPPEPVLREDRRLFYVGFTRARHMVFLVYSDSYTNQYGYLVGLGPSRFVHEISDRLQDTGPAIPS